MSFESSFKSLVNAYSHNPETRQALRQSLDLFENEIITLTQKAPKAQGGATAPALSSHKENTIMTSTPELRSAAEEAIGAVLRCISPADPTYTTESLVGTLQASLAGRPPAERHYLLGSVKLACEKIAEMVAQERQSCQNL